ncbi:hypothetical protein CKF48_13135 [Cytobacillus kochii]|uniref:Uncharacterized protein n=1 Tax=Cytobacillus kochii TaxID=859143 RepID=A0A248TJ73_9BACI|nr:hypothetical protein CKF48_13135 [Cytobacillus kochii]
MSLPPLMNDLIPTSFVGLNVKQVVHVRQGEDTGLLKYLKNNKIPTLHIEIVLLIFFYKILTPMQ